MHTRLVLFAFLVLVGLCHGAALRGADAPAELQGAWQVMGLVIDGRVVHKEAKPGRELAGFGLLVKDSRLTYTMVVNKKEVRVDFDIVNLDVGAATKPQSIDVLLQSGVWKGKVCLGIYELDGDTLKLCLADKPGKPRPETFQAKAGSGHQALTLRRTAP